MPQWLTSSWQMPRILSIGEIIQDFNERFPEKTLRPHWEARTR